MIFFIINLNVELFIIFSSVNPISESVLVLVVVMSTSSSDEPVGWHDIYIPSPDELVKFGPLAFKNKLS